MDLLRFSKFPLFLLFASQLLVTPASAQPALPGAMRIGESKPVTVNGAQFVAIAQTEWQPPRPDPTIPLVTRIEIHLRINNVSKSDLAFATDKTFGLKIFDADGKEVRVRTTCDDPKQTAPFVLPAGASHTLWRRAEVRWAEKANVPELAYYDGTGSKTEIGPLKPGRYKLVFWYAVPPDKQAKSQVGDAAQWVGEVVTHQVPIEMLEGVTQGGAVHPPIYPEVSREIWRMMESKPVTEKDARFVVAAPSQWKAGKGTAPIEIQMRITNLSKGDVLFHLFDAFHLVLRHADGKLIRATGGRDGTSYTKPVLLAPGGSYALCRKAELHWNAHLEAHELVYWDGTGRVSVYGPLPSGCYKASFYYETAPRELLREVWHNQHKNPTEVRVWDGGVDAEEITIEICDQDGFPPRRTR